MRTILFIVAVAMFGTGNQAYAQGQNRNLQQRVAELEAQVAALQLALTANTAADGIQDAGIEAARASADRAAQSAAAAQITADQGLSAAVTNAADIASLEGGIVANLGNYVSVDPSHPLGPLVSFTGANVTIVNGVGATDSINGLGNLIIGYNETRLNGSDKTGSHNLIIGREHNYTSFGGFVAGFGNRISGTEASVSGGFGNVASGQWSSVSGGRFNQASGDWSSVSGGGSNTASGTDASVSGGSDNQASADLSSVSGGAFNTASGTQSSVSGGSDNTASGANASVSGGEGSQASGFISSVSGGVGNTASGQWSSVSGGKRRNALGTHHWIGGGLLQEF